MTTNLRPSVIVTILLLSITAFNGAAEAEEIMVVPNQYVIQRKPETEVQKLNTTERSYLTRQSTTHFELVVPKSSGIMAHSVSAEPTPIDWSKVRADCAEIRKDPTVETCEPNAIKKPHVLPNDSLFSFQWGLYDPDYAADIKANIAWERGTGTKDTLVGIVDSGIYAEHPDLKDNLWSNPKEVDDGIDNDGNGYIDDIFGMDVESKSGSPTDCTGHGTHVAGIIGATGNNGRGVAGINWTTSLIAARISHNCAGSATIANTILGYDYFYDLKRRGHNIRVVNASIGGSYMSQAEYAAVSRLNSVDILLVASAGNENSNVDRYPSYPASFDLPNVISVGATGPRLRITLYSNYGDTVHIAAPGGDTDYSFGGILSTYSPLSASGLSYKLSQGTSMAAPMVTGALTLLASQRPYLTGAHLKEIMLQSADELYWLAPWVANGRFLNLGAMSFAVDPPDSCPSNPLKLEPGICGCASADRYVDADSDGTYDCVDQCPSDPAKTTSGACGCGVPDADTNGNGVRDCEENRITSLAPKAPILKAGKGSLTINVSQKPGTIAYVKIIVQTLKGKKKTTYLKLKTKTGRITKLPSGATVTVQYAYLVEKPARVMSSYGPAKKVKIK